MRAFVVDAFTDVAFRGNPAGVVLDDGLRDDAWRQSLAAELRHSETAFVRSRTDDGEYDLRWFTPTHEVDLCGHATLATAHVLATDGHTGPLVFRTRSGALHAEVDATGITLDFPASTVTPDPSLTTTVAAAISAAVQQVHRTSNDDLLAVVADEQTVATVRPDFDAVGRMGGRGLIVTAAAAADGSGRDFVSRFFAPNVGVDEDPVTGSAHCALAPFWAQRLGLGELVGYQLSARGGRVVVRLGDGRVQLRGTAVTVLAGELRI